MTRTARPAESFKKECIVKNLAGLPAEKSNPEVSAELGLAGVPAIETAFNKGRTPEVRSTVIGVLHFADGTLAVFSRQWYYWSVRMTKNLSRKQAEALNTLMGDVVRVDGFAGGTDVGGLGCNHWHVDTQTGLNTLVAVLMREFGEVSRDAIPSVVQLARQQLLNDAIYG